MINLEFTQYCYQSTLEIYYDDKTDERKKLIRSFNILKEFILKLDEENEQLFSGFYPRLHYVITAWQLPKHIAIKLHSLRYLAGRLQGDKSLALSGFELDLRLCDLFQVIHHISKVDFPKNVPFLSDEIQKESRQFFYDKQKKQTGDKVPFLRALVVSVEKHDTEEKYLLLVVRNERYDEVLLKLNGLWYEHPNMYPEGCILNVIDLGFDGKTYYTTQNSLVALEPDFLIDVTDIAECFGMGLPNPNLYFLSKFQKGDIGQAAVVGNLVNHIFDELLLDPEVDFDSAFERGLSQKPLQIISLMKEVIDLNGLRNRVAGQYHTLKLIIARLPQGNKKIEPSFISAKYGLQGRLDLLLEQENQKFVVELKSGSSPTKDIMYQDIDGKRYGSSIWRNHLVQAICYNMLLESAFSESKVTSAILYSSAVEKNLRNVPNILQYKKEILKCRNYIIAVEKAISNNNYSVFRKFNPKDFGNAPVYKGKAIEDFARSLASLSELEQEYFYNFISFVSREIFSRKVGQQSQSKGFSGLWLDSLEEKEDNFSLLRYMEIDSDESDFEKMHIVFKFSGQNAATSFRQGDICVVYHVPQKGKINPIKGQMLRGSIRQIDNDSVTVSFRNKLNPADFKEIYEWALEPDSIDSLNKHLYSSLYNLISSPPDKRNRLLGITEPQKKNIKKEHYPELNDLQNTLLYEALAADDYYLLMGPPGTGKTSFMLRHLVKYLFEQTEENVLLLAYTNMAADEICKALLRIDSAFPFLRLGSKDSTEFGGNLIAKISETQKIGSLADRLDKTRVFVSTVASALTNQEIFKIKHFDTTIIDEASQISEPYLFSILTRVERFILIGDEKQLPGIVTQPKNRLKIHSQQLEEISLRDLSVSYFERMLTNAKKKNWTSAFGMLTHQARMNFNIMQLANNLFYGNKLLLSPQREADNAFPIGTKILDILSVYDIVFIDTQAETGKKINHAEARTAVKILNEIKSALGEDFKTSSVGVICPFRAQVSLIKGLCSKETSEAVTIDTVERFQGSERDVIIFSFAVNQIYDIDKISNISMLDNVLVDRKLNVALTRARQKIVLIGNSQLLQYSELYRKLISYIQAEQCFLSSTHLD